MIDPFVLLAPILVFAVLALVRFVGCFIKPDRPVPPPVTVTFSGPEPVTPTGTQPEVPYKNLDFDANWAWERSTAQNDLNHVFFASPLKSGTFTFHDGPKFLQSMNVSAEPAGTITVSDDNSQNTPVVQNIPVTTGTSVNVPINWQNKSTVVTVSFTAQDSIGIDTIVYGGPA